ncbi:MAG: hypothetical protein JSV12_09360, partial [Candidatus Bathyarchaeota archaeon]
DIALLIAITIIIILYVTFLLRLKPSTKTTINKQPEKVLPAEKPAPSPSTQPELFTEEQTPPENPIMPEKAEPAISVKIPESLETSETLEEPLEYETPTIEESVEPLETLESKEEALPPTNPPECPHYFGHLKKLPKNLPIPDECLGCLRIIECLHQNPIS